MDCHGIVTELSQLSIPISEGTLVIFRAVCLLLKKSNRTSCQIIAIIF